MHYFKNFSFFPFLRMFFKYNMWLLPHQVKEQKARFLPMIWFVADVPGVFCKQLQFWKTVFRPVSLFLEMIILSNQHSLLTKNMRSPLAP